MMKKISLVEVDRLTYVPSGVVVGHIRCAYSTPRPRPQLSNPQYAISTLGSYVHFLAWSLLRFTPVPLLLIVIVRVLIRLPGKSGVWRAGCATKPGGGARPS